MVRDHWYKRLSCFAPAIIAVFAIGLYGCGEKEPDKKDETKRVGLAQSLRSYFDKVNGDYSQLSDADKAEYVRLSGSEEKASQNWEMMKNGPTRPPAEGQ